VASVSVLYIKDDIVGPHLELLRNICEPQSKSRPHVTVRYFDKLSIPKDHLKTVVRDVYLMGPGAFGFDEGDFQDNRTIFIRCESEDLLRLEHKPYYPTSEFHITVYDGFAVEFAEKLLQILKKKKWGTHVSLPPNSSLTAIHVKTKAENRRKVTGPREYDPKVVKLFLELTGTKLTWELVNDLSEKQRLKFANVICKSLNDATSSNARVAVPIRERSQPAPKYDSASDYDIHLTPPELAQQIARYAVGLLDRQQKSHVDFGDPAVGTGAFFSALLSVLPESSVASSIGIDISPKQVEAAKWRWKNKNMEVIEADFLHIETLPLRNLILANPPYLRHQGIAPKYKKELRERASFDMGMRISGLSGQYVYFVLLSHVWMTDNAIAAWLIPSEFMQTAYGKALRFYFSRKVQLLRVHQFGAQDRQFENAEVLPCVVFFKKIDPRLDEKALFTSGGTLSEPKISEFVRIGDLQSEVKWTIPFRKTVERSERFYPLGDLFSVRRGIATGANDFFVLERQRAMDLGIPDEVLRPLLPKAKLLLSDVIERQSDGFPDVERQLCVIDTDLSEEEIKKKYPKFMRYLKQGIADGVLNGHLVGRRTPWYKQEIRAPAPFLCTYMGKAHGDKSAIRFLWNKSDAVVTNTYLMLYPNPRILKLMQNDQRISKILFGLLKEAAWGSIDEFSRTHAGGLSKIEPGELQKVWLGPLPDQLLNVIDARLI
jgi:hypothetical protein